MNLRDAIRSTAWGAWIAASLLLGTAGPPPFAQALPPPVIREPVRAFDYYARATDPEVARPVQTAEEYHITDDTFWEQVRRKAWWRARGELEFVLRIVPNHPVALYLLEMVAHAEQDIAYPIAYYERALRMYPQHAITRAQYGRFLASVGLRGAGIFELRQAIAADSTLLQARAWLDEAGASRLKPPRLETPQGSPEHAP